MAVSASGAQLRLVEGGAAAALGIDADGTVFVPGNQVVVHMPLGRATPSDHTEQSRLEDCMAINVNRFGNRSINQSINQSISGVAREASYSLQYRIVGEDSHIGHNVCVCIACACVLSACALRFAFNFIWIFENIVGRQWGLDFC